MLASGSKTCHVRFDNNKYSVIARAVGRPAALHMWTPPFGKGFYERLCKTVGCSHMSGLCARLLWPPALMVSAGLNRSLMQQQAPKPDNFPS